MPSHITSEQLRDALCLRDLTDPAAGEHSMQRLVAAATTALAERWRTPVVVYRGERIVPVADNYDLLGYPADGPARDERYTRYVSDAVLLRSQMSAAIPRALRTLAPVQPDDVLVACPGIVYRRDVIDRLHVASPHQLDLWRVTTRGQSPRDLEDMIDQVVHALLPGATARVSPAEHPYTLDGREVEVRSRDEWVELLECGLAHPHVLTAAGLPGHHGLAMGIGLDRALMLRKGIDDIRLLRSDDRRIESQMHDLEPYHPVSAQPAARRDMSVCCRPGLTPEELGDHVRSALNEHEQDWIEEITLISRTPVANLPDARRLRMGAHDSQENLLLRITLRHPTKSLPKPEANHLRDRIYLALHQGSHHELTTRAA